MADECDIYYTRGLFDLFLLVAAHEERPGRYQSTILDIGNNIQA